MAIRKNNILGQTSGKLGNTVTRIRGGKEVVYALPDKVKVSNSNQARAARNKFALTVGFAKFINSIPELSCTWTYAKIPGTNSFQKLIKHNSKLTGEKSLTLKNIITPAGFDFNIETLSLANGNLRFTIKLSEVVLPALLLSKPHIHSVLYFYEPVIKNVKPFLFSHLSSEIGSVMPDNTAEIHLDLTVTGQNLFRNYSRIIIYFAIVACPQSAGNPVWSNTVAGQIEY